MSNLHDKLTESANKDAERKNETETLREQISSLEEFKMKQISQLAASDSKIEHLMSQINLLEEERGEQHNHLFACDAERQILKNQVFFLEEETEKKSLASKKKIDSMQLHIAELEKKLANAT